MSLGNLAEKLDDALWVISGIPGYIRLDVKSTIGAKKILRDEKKAAKEAEKAKANQETDFREVDTGDLSNEKKETKSEVKKALSTINYSSFNGTDLGEQIDRIAQDNEALKIILVAKATNTSKWIQYGLYYMSDPDAKLVAVVEPKTKEFLNGLSAMFGFGKMYESADTADLETFDPKSEKFSIKLAYLLSVEALKEKAKPYLAQMEERKKQLEEMQKEDDMVDFGETGVPKFTTVKDEGDNIIHPVFFVKKDASDEWVKQGENISDELFKKLEDNFSELLEGYDYRYEMCETGLINLFIKRRIITGFAQDIYTIDPGIVMGKDKFYILGRIPNDTIFVSVDHKIIVREIINSKFYILRPDEIQKVAMDYFYNNNIYKYIDMSNTGFLNKLDSDSYQKLGKKLTFIINQLKSLNDGITEVPRFRFDKFESVEKFSIVSDDKVVSPLKNSKETSSEIANGLSFTIDGDNVVQKMNDLSINYKIDHYAEM